MVGENLVTNTDTAFGNDLIAALQEVRAHRRGEIALASKIFHPISPARVKEIRRGLTKSPAEFERKFGVPARALEGWEQGLRAPDRTAASFLRVIEANPEAVEKALAGK